MPATANHKLKFGVLIGAGVVAAAATVYLTHLWPPASMRATQGAIGQRQVYRDGQVKEGDVAAPGSAPVAVKEFLQSQEFQEGRRPQTGLTGSGEQPGLRLARQQPYVHPIGE